MIIGPVQRSTRSFVYAVYMLEIVEAGLNRLAQHVTSCRIAMRKTAVV